MKIAYVQAFYLPAIDGPATVIHEIASRLAKQGHEVHVFCSDSDKHKKIDLKEEVLDGVKIHRLNNWFQIGFATFFPSVFFKLMKEAPILGESTPENIDVGYFDFGRNGFKIETYERFKL